MEEMDRSELLKIPEVVEEIKRHLWIESEKTGYDIGFDRAAADWINKYAEAWLNHYRPNAKLKPKVSAVVPTKPAAAPVSASKSEATVVKKRRAKSYNFR